MHKRRHGEGEPVADSYVIQFTTPVKNVLYFSLAFATERGSVVSRQKYSEEYFRTVFEAAPSGVLAVDASGRIALLNAQAERMFGYNRAELIGKPVELLVPQRFRGRHADLCKRDAANPRICPMGTDRSFLGVRKDGSEFPVEVGLNLAVMSTGYLVVATVVDITKRNARRHNAWHATTVAALFLVFCLVFSLVIVGSLKPITQIIPERILAFGAGRPAQGVDAAYAAYQNRDYTSALRLARPVADQGDSRAQSLLGLMYSNGQGVQRNEAEAMKWYWRAADQGEADAQVKIGDMYFEGRIVAQDYSEAGRWYRFAADHGNAAAQYYLGILYAKGEGVPLDNVLAHMWFNLAAVHFTSRLSRDRAIALRDTIARKLSPAEIARAQEMAREWQTARAPREIEMIQSPTGP